VSQIQNTRVGRTLSNAEHIFHRGWGRQVLHVEVGFWSCEMESEDVWKLSSKTKSGMNVRTGTNFDLINKVLFFCYY